MHAGGIRAGSTQRVTMLIINAKRSHVGCMHDTMIFDTVNLLFPHYRNSVLDLNVLSQNGRRAAKGNQNNGRQNNQKLTFSHILHANMLEIPL